MPPSEMPPIVFQTMFVMRSMMSYAYILPQIRFRLLSSEQHTIYDQHTQHREDGEESFGKQLLMFLL